MSNDARRLSRRRFVAVGAGASAATKLGLLAGVGAAAAQPTAFKEAPMLAEQVSAGTLPPVEERLPAEPLVVEPLTEIGRYGGVLRGGHTAPTVFEGWMVASADGLLWLDSDFKTPRPNLATEWALSEDGKILTLSLRQGVKWSDGQPFTADDILFWWEDVILNDELTPAKPPLWSPGGTPMTVEKVDDYTVRMTFAAPYYKIPLLLADHQGFDPVVHPKHFLQQFHVKYADAGQLEAAAQEAGVDRWDQLFKKMALGHPIFMTTAPADMPTLSPMVLKSNDSGNVRAERNPYYWKVDPEGNQLPYIDGINYPIVQDPEALKLKILAGEIDWESLHTILQDFPLLKENEEQGNYRTLLWNANFSGNICVMFNQTHSDPETRKLFQDVRFRRAMSIGLDRNEINQVMFLGQAVMQQVVPNEGTSYYVKEYADAYTQFDMEAANALLDEIGLNERDGDGFRMRPDGQPLNITWEFWNGHSIGPPSELVADQWRTNLNVRVTTRSIARDLWNERMRASEHDVTSFVTDKMSEIHFPTRPNWIVPLSQVESSFGTKWAQWYLTDGAEGEEPIEEVLAQLENFRALQTAPQDEAIELGKAIAQSEAENLWAIGTAATSPMPIVASKNLGNIPESLPFYGNDWKFTVITHPETWFFKT